MKKKINNKIKEADKFTLLQFRMVDDRDYYNNIVHHVDGMKKVYQHKYVLQDNLD
jgi:hypothetical protein